MGSENLRLCDSTNLRIANSGNVVCIQKRYVKLFCWGGGDESFCCIGTIRISRTNYEDYFEYLYSYKYECWHSGTNIKSIVNPNTLTSANMNSKINRHIITHSSAKIHIHIRTSTNAISSTSITTNTNTHSNTNTDIHININTDKSSYIRRKSETTCNIYTNTYTSTNDHTHSNTNPHLY